MMALHLGPNAGVDLNAGGRGGPLAVSLRTENPTPKASKIAGDGPYQGATPLSEVEQSQALINKKAAYRGAQGGSE